MKIEPIIWQSTGFLRLRVGTKYYDYFNVPRCTYELLKTLGRVNARAKIFKILKPFSRKEFYKDGPTTMTQDQFEAVQCEWEKIKAGISSRVILQ